MATWTASKNFERLPPSIQELIRTGASLLVFDYTAEQWAQIGKSIEQFQAKQEAIENARLHLQNSARRFYLEMLNGPGRKQESKWRLKHWTKAGALADALMSELGWLARDEIKNGPPDPSEVRSGPAAPSGNGRKPYYEDRLALMKISVMARRHILKLGGKFDDGIPRIAAKSAYHFEVLGVWIELGGKLKISRHPSTGKIKGPLARYFSAVTQPVHGGSPESLPDIIERHLAHKAALDKWRLDLFLANAAP